jgi:uncharacterized cupin superfamily protein
VPDYTKLNLKRDVEDQAPNFGFAPNVEARFARKAMGLENSGISYQRVAPGFRMPFGHRHGEQEELYLVLSGGGRAKLEEEIVELEAWDLLRVPPEVMRAFEAGPEGAELIAFGAGPAGDVEMEPGWWED